MSDLDQRLQFLVEIDKLKTVVRASPLADKSRKENSAEHSWHLAMYALILADFADDEINLERVIRMLLLHDIVEIDAGDTPLHKQDSQAEQLEKEMLAAERIFGLLPAVQTDALQALWLEFEAAETSDARFAKSLDRLQPLLQNIMTDGGTWTEAGVTRQQVLERYGPTIEAGSAELWRYARSLVDRHFASPGDE